MQLNVFNDGNGLLLSVNKDGNREATHIRNNIHNAEELQEIAIGFHSVFEENGKTYQLEAAIEQNAKHLDAVGTTLLRNAHAALRAEKRKAVARRTTLLEPTPQTQADLTFEQAFVGRLDAMPTAQRLAALSGELSLAHTSALLRHGDLRRLVDQPEIIARVERSHILAKIEQIAGDRFPARPTPAEPLPVGLDHNAAHAAAAAELDGLDAEIAAIDSAGRAWAGLVRFAAVAADRSANDVFAAAIAA